MLKYNVIREVDKMELIANIEHLQDAINIALTAWMNTDCHYIVISIQRFGILLIGHEVYATKSLERLISPLSDGHGSLLDYSRQSN